MNAGKAILRILRVLGIIILIPVVLALLVLLIGFITDLAMTSSWKQAQRESLEYFARIKDQRYSSGVSFAALNANAWNDYDRAVKRLDSLSAEDKKAITALTGERDSFDLKLAERLAQTYAPALALLDSGAACTYCAIPYEYEKGPAMPILKYISLQTLAKLGLIRGRMEMAQGKPQAAAESYAKVLKLGADIGGGGEVLIGRMVGIVIGQAAVKQIALDLDRFDLTSALLLEEILAKLEGGWPSPLASLETEYRLLFLPSASGWNGSDLLVAYYAAPRPSVPATLPQRFAVTLLSWRQFFSVRRALLEGARTGLELSQADREVQGKPWSEVRPRLARTDSLMERRRGEWSLNSVAIPNYTRFSRRYYEFLCAVRVLKAALALRQNHGVPRKEPELLLSLEAFRDPADNQPLRLKSSPSGKGLRLYSVGLNLVDDGGEGSRVGERAKEQAKDDIWIEVP
jgi:hypothetical protein